VCSSDLKEKIRRKREEEKQTSEFRAFSSDLLRLRRRFAQSNAARLRLRDPPGGRRQEREQQYWPL